MADVSADTDVMTEPSVRMASAVGRWVLVATVLGSGMAMLDGTVVNLALVRMGEDLDISFGGLQWVINGYTLSLAALILVGGALGDRFGRKELFVAGTVWFTAASVLCAIAPNAEVLIAARVLQGIGGALLTPGSLAIIQASFDPRDRAKAIGAWSGLGGVATGIGPFVGGWLVDVATWRSVFLINVPIGAAVVAMAVRHVPETKGGALPVERAPASQPAMGSGGAAPRATKDDTNAGGPLDVPGAVVGAVALAATSYGLTEQEWAILAAGLAMAVLFVVIEMRSRAPMLPMSVFRSMQFSGTNFVTFLLYGSLAVSMFLLGLVLQQSLGYSPLLAGAATTPITIFMLVLSAQSGALAQRIGPRIPMTVGPVVCAVGLALLTRVAPGVSYLAGVLPGILVFGAGITITVAPLTTTALGAVDTHLAGIASGVNNAVARTGQLVAIAAVPLLAGFLPGAAVAAGELVDGFHQVLWIAAAVTAASGAVAWATIRNPPRVEPAVSITQFHCSTVGPPVAVHAD